MSTPLQSRLADRFGDHPQDPGLESVPDLWTHLAGRSSCRRFTDEPVDIALLETLSALALCSPTKSDLQQRDIIVVEDEAIRARLSTLLTGGRLGQDWIEGAPRLLVFCGNNRRQRLVHTWRGHPFVNDHLDAFFNAAVDAGIAMTAFILAAEAAGLGCCPISAIRNQADTVSDILNLPDHVFPVCGLAVGWPQFQPPISPRLGLGTTLHRDCYSEDDLHEAVETYDRRRNLTRPFSTQRGEERFGTHADYGWSEDKARQYAEPEREDFGRFVRAKGFRLD
ncbi:MAG: nitroreductase family protein [Pseudomonadota bacterium]